MYLRSIEEKKQHKMLLRFITGKALMNTTVSVKRSKQNKNNSDHWKKRFRMNRVLDSIPLSGTQCHILRTCLDRILIDIDGYCRRIWRGLHESGKLCRIAM